METIGVFIVDNSSMFRDGLRQGLARAADIQVLGESGMGEEAVELVASFSPEVVLLDVGAPLLTGLDLARRLTERTPGIHIVVFDSHEDDERLFQAVRSGAVGYLSKDVTADELVSAVKRVCQGEHIISEKVLARPKVAEKVLRQFQAISLLGMAMEKVAAPLTPKELEILSYVAQGYMNKQIAHQFGISEQTIKNRMSSILRKLDANDRTQAVVMALRHGWISPQPRQV